MVNIIVANIDTYIPSSPNIALKIIFTTNKHTKTIPIVINNEYSTFLSKLSPLISYLLYITIVISKV